MNTPIGYVRDRGMMKILEFTSSYPNCDNPVSGIFVRDLSGELSRRFQIVVLGPGGRGMPETEHIDGIAVRRFTPGVGNTRFVGTSSGMVPLFKRKKYLWLLLPFFLLTTFFKLRRVIREERPDWVHAHWVIPFGLLAVLNRTLSRGGGPRILVTCHGADINKLSSRPLLALKRFVLRRADAVTAVSETLKGEVLEQRLTDREISVASMGVETGRFRRGISVPDVRAKLGIGSGRYVLAVGSLIERKGVHDLLEALPEVRKVSGDVHLVYAGDGVLRERLLRRAAELGLSGQVHLAGIVDRNELPAYFSQAAAFCLPSTFEGLGMVVMEALCSGCEVVLSSLPVLKNLPDSDRLFHWCDTGNPASIASALNQALAASAADGELAFRRSYVEEHFGIRVAAARYAAIFERAEA